VDAASFADYRSVYYKGDTVIKVVDKDWVSMGLPDPRGQYARYWYARSLDTPVESLYAVPDGLTRWNVEVDPSLWTEEGLTRITTQAPAQVRVEAAEEARADRGRGGQGRSSVRGLHAPRPARGARRV
jgi:hypothetical protein